MRLICMNLTHGKADTEMDHSGSRQVWVLHVLPGGYDAQIRRSSMVSYLEVITCRVTGLESDIADSLEFW